ncbi:hypothetical protein PC123_g24203 [Phytophthora cactorum]|nr:hypothetical protein PC123_g24203 [Phytophthora cactorum]
MEAGIPCAAPFGTSCSHCPSGAERLSKRDVTGYTTVCVPVQLRDLRVQLERRDERRDTPSVSGDRSARAGVTPALPKAHQLRELMTRQAVLAVANAQHRESLCARVQPDCTKKRYAIKPGLIVCVHGKNPPTVTTTESRKRPGLDEEQVDPGSTTRNDGTSNTS